ncbi:MAG: adenosylcobinamide-GDP ribazoletransferase [Methylotenera sp.]|nr:adenosylcobinamide-GDP ribazoletransferase [Methylotenera sp.]MDO9232677.1 adenosylcobinamide-GDP ribazoletransferase [Methylotenera sp.]MDO9388625.1 adenosylcobinamide-GDP ribazoletransferase [Methylotenera sp.]MDP2404321.1 adenosylcobinamide-GDP ribazoletransferase [Methylotenera sp.]MDP3095984.1 adenosylcobinamide-GDP ribazoletransferase [Methylotenera sp.]
MLNCLRREQRYFLLAVGFFTRLPVPNFNNFYEDELNYSAKYFPLVGVIVGMVGAGAFTLAAKVLPSSIAILVSMAATIYITGAFHEDGLADSADGLGGGSDRERILTIMQDSRLGTYGAVALFLMLFAKFQVLNALPIYFLPFILIVGHAFSRLCALYVMADLSYVKVSGKAKPLATKVDATDLTVATLFGLSPIPFLYWNFSPFILNANDWLWLGVYCLLPVAIVWIWWRNKIKHWLGGYTGDCLGAMQQITELAFYFGLLAWYQQL